MHQPIQHILKQRMDRKQFLRTVGMMLLVVIGLSFLVRQPQRSVSAAPHGAPANNDTYGG